MFKIGDKVKLSGCPFDLQRAEEALMYGFLVNQIMTVTEVKRVFEEGTSGQWIKTDMTPDWIDAFWFAHAE
jgi:hypothetical protein